MDKSRQELADKYEQTQRTVSGRLADRDISLPQAEEYLKEFRPVCQDLILCDILYAHSLVVETHLWTAHSRVNTLFRKQLALTRKQGPTRVVELHKFMKLYLTFLKDSQRFYRQLIQRLNATYGAIPELEQLAQPEQSQANVNVSESPEVRSANHLSCHRSLIYLGDLSRYRATERLDKNPAWGPAVGYYTLAAALRPSSGMAYHQLSVVAIEEDDHLKAIYFLYRAIVVDEPHPNAISNLGLEFRKMRKAWDSGAGMPKFTSADPQSRRKIMTAWFIRLHSISFDGDRIPARAEHESEVQTRLVQQIKANEGEGIISKMCFVNFAAQATAAARLQAQPTSANHRRAYFYCLETNLKTMTTLLECLAGELMQTPSSTTAPAMPQALFDKLTAVAASLLPFLRLYGAWLLTNAQTLTSDIGGTGLQNASSRLWSTYARTMSLVSKVFPVVDLPGVDYELPEDVEAFGFKALESRHTWRLWHDQGRKLPKYTEVAERLDPAMEALARLRGLLIDALLLSMEPNDPLNFDGTRFAVNNSARSLQSSANLSNVSPGTQLTQQPLVDPRSDSVSAVRPGQVEHEAVRRMSEMVDDLVGEDREYSGTGQRPSDTLARRLSALNSTPAQQRPPSAESTQRLQSVSSLWGYESPLQPPTPHPEVSSTQRLGQLSRGHSRGNSTTSLHSASSGQVGALASSFVPTPPSQVQLGRITTDHGPSRLPTSAASDYDSGMNSPLLFGNGGVWSSRPRRSVQNDTPPNGQGG